MTSIQINNLIRLSVLSIALSLALLPNANAETLNLQTFRAQAKTHSTLFKAAKSKLIGAQGSRESHEQLTNTRLFSGFSYMDDKRPTTNPNFQGDRTVNMRTNIGIKKQTLWGPSVQIAQNVARTSIANSAIANPEYYDVYPSVEVSIPLWRNFLGAETKAQYQKLKSLNEAQLKGAEAEMVFTEADIDMAYYNLRAHRETVELQKELLSRAEKIRNWVSGQNKRGLADPSDVHQANAAVTLRKLELESAENSLKAAARAFNLLRGRDSEVVEEDLEESPIDLERLKLGGEKLRKRKDLLAQQNQIDSQSQDYLAARETFKPELDLTFSSQWFGRDQELSEARADDRDQPYTFVGLVFSIPLDVPEMNRSRRGYADLARSAELAKKAVEERQSLEWRNFVDLGEQLYKQVALARDLEATQRKKADTESLRFSRGRSTTFQVLSFEQDYINAKSQRISVELQARRYLTEIALFE